MLRCTQSWGDETGFVDERLRSSQNGNYNPRLRAILDTDYGNRQNNIRLIQSLPQVSIHANLPLGKTENYLDEWRKASY